MPFDPVSFAQAKRALAAATPSEIARAPNSGDSSAKGFAIGNLWREPGNRRLWECRRAVAPAVWMPRAGGSPILAGAIASGLMCSVGMRRINPDYTGPAFTVKRDSDNATLNVGYLPEGGIDGAAFYNFVKAGPYKITQWFDNSGLANHPTAIDAESPVITPYNYIGNSPAMWFDTNNKVQTPAAKIIKRFALPAGVAAQIKTLSCVALVRAYHSTRQIPILGLTTLAPYAALNVGFGWKRASGIETLNTDMPNGTTTQGSRFLPGAKPPVTPVVVGFCSGNTITNWFGDRLTNTIGNVSSSVFTQGGHIGTTAGYIDSGGALDCGGFGMGALLIFNANLTQAQYTAIAEALYSDFDTHPQRRGRIICEGDSITEEPQTQWFQSWPHRMVAQLNSAPEVYNVGISGGTFSSQFGNPVPAALTNVVQWSQMYDASAPFNIVHIALGTNDLTAGRTGAQMYADATAAVTYLKGLGFSCVVDTVLPFSTITAGQDTERQAYNALLRAGWRGIGCAFLPDIALEPTMNAAGAVNDVSLYYDGKHPTETGLAYIATWRAAAFNAYLGAL